MSGRLTIWGAQQMLTAYITASATVPQTFWLALVCSIPPTPYMSGLELDEPTLPEYGRVGIDNIPMNWMNDAQPQEIYNVIDVAFTTAVSDWGQINYWALCDDQFGGNNFVVGQLEQPLLILAGDQVVMQSGDLNVALGPFFLVDDA